MVLEDFLDRILLLVLTLGQLIGRAVLFNGVSACPRGSLWELVKRSLLPGRCRVSQFFEGGFVSAKQTGPGLPFGYSAVSPGPQA